MPYWKSSFNERPPIRETKYKHKENRKNRKKRNWAKAGGARSEVRGQEMWDQRSERITELYRFWLGGLSCRPLGLYWGGVHLEIFWTLRCWSQEAEEVLLCPPKQGATEQKENNAFSKSAFNDEMKGTPEMEENSYPLIRMEEPQGHVWRCKSWKSWTSRLCTWRNSRSRSEQVTSGS